MRVSCFFCLLFLKQDGNTSSFTLAAKTDPKKSNRLLLKANLDVEESEQSEEMARRLAQSSSVCSFHSRSLWNHVEYSKIGD